MLSEDITKREKIKKKLSKLHEQSTSWMSDLEFMKDEQIFLEHLLSTHFLDLSKSKLYEPTRKLIKKLKDVEKMGRDLFDKIQLHNKHLSTLIESSKYKGKKGFKKEHRHIEKDFETYELNFKYVKKKIFNMIKDIMKNHKQKLLIKKE